MKNIIIIVIILLLLLIFVKKNNNEIFTLLSNEGIQNIESVYNITNKLRVPSLETQNILARKIDAETINSTNMISNNITSRNMMAENINTRTINNININNNKWNNFASWTGISKNKCWSTNGNMINTNTNNCDKIDENLFTYEYNTLRNKKYPTKCVHADNYNNTISLGNCEDYPSRKTWIYYANGYYFNPISSTILNDNGTNLNVVPIAITDSGININTNSGNQQQFLQK
jgi:hypothetical protein